MGELVDALLYLGPQDLRLKEQLPADVALDVDYRKELQRREALTGVPGAARATPKDLLKELDQQIVNGADNPLFAIPKPQDRSLPDPRPQRLFNRASTSRATATHLNKNAANDEPHFFRMSPGLLMLTDGKDIAIWIFEPRYLVTRRSCPDSKLAILHEGILFQNNASVSEPSDDRFDIFHFPAQDRALQRSEIWDFCNPNLMPSDAHDQCVLIEAYKLTSEVSSIEGTRLVVILGGNKANHLSRSEHLFLRDSSGAR